MIQFLMLYPKSMDIEKVEKNIKDLEASMKNAPGCQSLKVSEGDIMSPAGPPAYSKVFEGVFESLEAFMGWVQSPWAQSAEQQAEKNAMIEQGAVMLFYEIKAV